MIKQTNKARYLNYKTTTIYLQQQKCTCDISFYSCLFCYIVLHICVYGLCF